MLTAGVVRGSHAYSAAGVYTGTVRVTDDDGATGTATFVVRAEDDALDPAIYRVPGEPGTSVTLTFDWNVREADYDNEMGIFVVDNGLGQVAGKIPTGPGYWKAALGRAQVTFTTSQTAGARRQVTLPAGTLFSLYLVEDDTTSRARQQNGNHLPTNPHVWFPFASLNADGHPHWIRTDQGDGRTQYQVEDLAGGGDEDFDDMVFTVTTVAPGYAGQTKFFVADKGTDEVLRYDAGGAYVGYAGLRTQDGGNTDPRGVASNVQGSKLWVIDADKKVYVYGGSGNFQGSWTAKNLSSPQGITTDGTHIWIVDSGDDRLPFRTPPGVPPRPGALPGDGGRGRPGAVRLHPDRDAHPPAASRAGRFQHHPGAGPRTRATREFPLRGARRHAGAHGQPDRQPAGAERVDHRAVRRDHSLRVPRRLRTGRSGAAPPLGAVHPDPAEHQRSHCVPPVPAVRSGGCPASPVW